MYIKGLFKLTIKAMYFVSLSKRNKFSALLPSNKPAILKKENKHNGFIFSFKVQCLGTP